jgi:hypothetical protein
VVSPESFVLCQHYTPPQGYVPTIINPMLDYQYGTLSFPYLRFDVKRVADKKNVICWSCCCVADSNELVGPNRVIVPFIACGDLKVPFCKLPPFVAPWCSRPNPLQPLQGFDADTPVVDSMSS